MPFAPNRLRSQFCSAQTYGFKEWSRPPRCVAEAQRGNVWLRPHLGKVQGRRARTGLIMAVTSSALVHGSASVYDVE